jgi:hypothetical protein
MLSFVASAIVLAGLLTSAFLLMGAGRWGPSTYDIRNVSLANEGAMGGTGGGNRGGSRHLRQQRQTSSTKKFKVLEQVIHDGTSFV